MTNEKKYYVLATLVMVSFLIIGTLFYTLGTDSLEITGIVFIAIASVGGAAGSVFFLIKNNMVAIVPILVYVAAIALIFINSTVAIYLLIGVNFAFDVFLTAKCFQ